MRKLPALFLLVFAGMCISVGAQQVPAAIDTDPPADSKFPATMDAFQLPSHGALLNALFYVAPGPGPHPVVVLLHGFPGNEKNLDLAQAIRRAGWDVLFFNYRGSWGSPGDFSFTHCQEDVASALAYLRDPANAVKLRADPKRIVLVGHSMGGFMTAYGAAHDPAVIGIGLISAADMAGSALHVGGSGDEAVAKLASRLAEEGLAPLAGTSPEALARELLAHSSDWPFLKLASGFGNRAVLIVTSDDGLAPSNAALATALKQAGNSHVVQKHFATDHSYSDKRIGLEEAVLAWLATIQ